VVVLIAEFYCTFDSVITLKCLYFYLIFMKKL